MLSVRRPRKLYEEYAYVIDYIPYGRGYRAEPTVQLVGESYFTLLEAVLKEDATVSVGERVYVGKEGRTKISYIKSRLRYDELTSAAKAQLLPIIEKIMKSREEHFIRFFNQASAVTPRMHALELIPGVGKKLTHTILKAREVKPFESFQDLKDRTGILNPLKLLAKRVLIELKGEDKYYLFTRPPVQESQLA